MKKTWTRVTLVLLLAVVAIPVLAQTGDLQDQKVDLEQVRQLRSQAENNSVLSENVRSAVLKFCDDSIDSLQRAIDNRAAEAAYKRDLGGVDSQVRNLRAAIEQSERHLHLDLPENSTVDHANDALAREQARLAANRSALRDLERVAEDRRQARTDISERLGELDLELELFNDELRAEGDSTTRTELRHAHRLSILARKEAALTEVEMLRARLTLLADRSVLNPLEIDLAQRRVSTSEQVVNILVETTHELREEQARDLFGRIQEQSRQLAKELPTLAPLAAETENLAGVLWGPDGLIVRSESMATALVTIRRHQAELNRIAELALRKYQAYGRQGSITRWWPNVPEDFPKTGAVGDRIRRLDEEIPEVDYQLITNEQERSAAPELTRKIMLELEMEFGDQLDLDLVPRVRHLLSTRQDLLDRLILEGGRYSNQLAEYRTLSANFLGRLEEIEQFLFAHALWSRSVPRPIIPGFRTLVDAAGWLISPEHLRSINIVGMGFRGDGLFEALLLIVILLLRQPMRRRLKDIGERISDPSQDGFRFTLKALVITGLLAAPLPLALLIASITFGNVGDSAYFFSLAAAMSKLALVAAFFELIRQIFAPLGLAEAHFGWPVHATRPLHRGLLLTEVIGLPLLYIALHLGFAGARLDSPSQLQLYNNSLGRIAFVAALAVFGFSILTMLRPGKNLEPSDQDVRVPWPRRFSEYAFPTAFLGAYPIVILATIVPALLAFFGFYITALLLAYQMLRTLLLGVFVLVVGGVIHRRRIVNRNRDYLSPDQDANNAPKAAEIEANEKQVRQLFKAAIIAVLTFGLFAIWSDALPWLQILKRVQVLPRIELLQEVDDTAVLAGPGVAIGAPSTQPETSEGVSTGYGVPIPGSGEVESAAGSSQTSESSPLMVWGILQAILVALVMMLLVKNLPSVIEIILKRQTTLDGGARFAFSTLVRYLITIVGTIAFFGLLGVTWGKVQWLAAALTFGLGFGLQEIVANFVSGLILLVERPVRVGDVVTVGTLMGKVNRIQIRATTITLWDRSEMIVPNKEFITTKLVNWTLSDSKRRIDIPLRVAYGADLDEVREVLVDIAMQHPSVLHDPAPHTLLLSFGEDAIKFELRFVVDFGQGLTTKDQVQMAIESAFREKGIEFALPKSEVRLISGGDTNVEKSQ